MKFLIWAVLLATFMEGRKVKQKNTGYDTRGTKDSDFSALGSGKLDSEAARFMDDVFRELQNLDGLNWEGLS